MYIETAFDFLQCTQLPHSGTVLSSTTYFIRESRNNYDTVLQLDENMNNIINIIMDNELLLYNG